MTLAFSTTINGEPSYFPEKIIEGFDLEDYKKCTLHDLLNEVVLPSFEDFSKGSCNPLFDHVPKIHTIRQDKTNRWKKGMDIHFVINNRTPDRYEFGPDDPHVKCTGVQEIEIKNISHCTPNKDVGYVETHLISPGGSIIGGIGIEKIEMCIYWDVVIDKCSLSPADIETLAVNDGFSNADAFFKYFEDGFTGRLIHWSDKRY